MNDIEVGEYVRTEKGYIGILVNMFTHENGKVEYPEPQEWNIRLSNGKIYVIYEADMQDNIKKHSKNLKELVEAGDIVNGYMVGIYYGYDEDGNDKDELGILFDYEENTGLYLEDVKIQSILTHELYNANCFKAEG